MRRIFTWTALFILLCSTPAMARLGETLEKCRYRYGSPVHGPVGKGDNLVAEYEWQIYDVTIVFSGNRAQRITYRLQDNKPISIRRFQNLLEDNPSATSGMYRIRGNNTWYITATGPGNNRVTLSHKDDLATGYYHIDKKELVVTLSE